MKWRASGSDFLWIARNGAQRQGKKVEDGRCRDKIESPRSGIGLRSDQPLSRTQMGAPVAKHME
jgi:hypothetical protein